MGVRRPNPPPGDICPACNGLRTVPGFFWGTVACFACSGTGVIPGPQPGIDLFAGHFRVISKMNNQILALKTQLAEARRVIDLAAAIIDNEAGPTSNSAKAQRLNRWADEIRIEGGLMAIEEGRKKWGTDLQIGPTDEVDPIDAD